MASKGSDEQEKKVVEKPMNRIVIEKASKCKLVRTGSEANGHDCWGCTEFYHYDYVYVNNKEERLYSLNEKYILHDDKTVFDTGSISDLNEKFRMHLDKEFYDKETARLKEERYKRFLKLKKEFDNDPIYVRDQKINKVIG